MIKMTSLSGLSSWGSCEATISPSFFPFFIIVGFGRIHCTYWGWGLVVYFTLYIFLWIIQMMFSSHLSFFFFLLRSFFSSFFYLIKNYFFQWCQFIRVQLEFPQSLTYDWRLQLINHWTTSWAILKPRDPGPLNLVMYWF